MELISLHVPKCAGSALLEALKGIYGEENFYLDYEDQVIRPASPVNIDPEGYVRYFKTLREPLLAGKRVAPKKRLGRCNALASTPPVSTLPDDGITVL